MKRKVLALLVTAAMAVSMAACGNSSSSTASTADSTASETASGTSVVESAAEESTTETEESTAEADSTAAAEGTTYKVGIIQYVDDASLNQIQANIQSQLDTLGDEYGVTFDYADYTKNGQADGTVLQQIASELISDDVDIIIPIATPTAQIVQAATEENQIPVVFAASSDPVGAKLVDSMEAPGSNITGTSDALNTNAIFDLMFAANPDIQTVGLLYSNSEDSSTQAIADAKAYLDEKGVSYDEKTGTTIDEVSLAADSLIADGVDAIFTPTDNTIMTAELTIYEKLAEAGIPHYAGADSFALNGSFVGYGVDYANLGVETANMAADILLNGTDPGTVEVETFDNGIATVNTEICEQLGYDIDEIKEAFAPYCTQVNEIQTAEEFEE